jgi:hypothetical protein
LIPYIGNAATCTASAIIQFIPGELRTSISQGACTEGAGKEPQDDHCPYVLRPDEASVEGGEGSVSRDEDVPSPKNLLCFQYTNSIPINAASYL